MHSYLKKYLEKIGVKEFSELTPEEKETYTNWEQSLVGKKLTDDDVARFLVGLEEDIIKELIDTKTPKERDLFLKMQLDLIRKIKGFLRTPELEKKMTEYQLMNLINSK